MSDEPTPTDVLAEWLSHKADCAFVVDFPHRCSCGLEAAAHNAYRLTVQWAAEQTDSMAHDIREQIEAGGSGHSRHHR